MLRILSVVCVYVVLMSNTLSPTDAVASNGVFQRCGNDAKDFLRWFCADPSFAFPFPFSRVYIFLRYRPSFKGLHPFRHQASQCCQFGCDENGYQKMCHYHRKLKKCEHRRTIRLGVGRRTRRFSYCRL